jgi:hypothetical protein
MRPAPTLPHIATHVPNDLLFEVPRCRFNSRVVKATGTATNRGPPFYAVINCSSIIFPTVRSSCSLQRFAAA